MVYKIIIACMAFYLCGFTYGYKDNPQTGKKDLVTTGITIPDVTGLGNATPTADGLMSKGKQTITVSTESELIAAVANSAKIILAANIVLNSDLIINNPGLVIDGHGYQISATNYRLLLVQKASRIENVSFFECGVGIKSTASNIEIINNTFDTWGLMVGYDTAMDRTAANTITGVKIKSNIFRGVRQVELIANHRGDILYTTSFVSGNITGAIMFIGNNFEIISNEFYSEYRTLNCTVPETLPSWLSSSDAEGDGFVYGRAAVVYSGYNNIIAKNVQYGNFITKISIHNWVSPYAGSSSYNNTVTDNTCYDIIAEAVSSEGYGVAEIVVNSVNTLTNVITGTIKTSDSAATSSFDPLDLFVFGINGGAEGRIGQLTAYSKSSGILTITVSSGFGDIDLTTISNGDILGVSQLSYRNEFSHNHTVRTKKSDKPWNSYNSRTGISIFLSSYQNIVRDNSSYNCGTGISITAIRVRSAILEGNLGRYSCCIGNIIENNTDHNLEGSNYYAKGFGFISDLPETDPTAPAIWANRNIIANNNTFSETAALDYVGSTYSKNLTNLNNSYSFPLYWGGGYRNTPYIGTTYNTFYGTAAGPPVNQHINDASLLLFNKGQSSGQNGIEIRQTDSLATRFPYNRITTYLSDQIPAISNVANSVPSYNIFTRGGTADTPANSPVGAIGALLYGTQTNNTSNNTAAAVVANLDANSGVYPETSIGLYISDGTTSNIKKLNVDKNGLTLLSGKYYGDGSQLINLPSGTLPVVSISSTNATLAVNTSYLVTGGLFYYLPAGNVGDRINISNNSSTAIPIKGHAGSTFYINGQTLYANSGDTYSIAPNESVMLTLKGPYMWVCDAKDKYIAGGGSVTSVTSANNDISVATTTTTPVLTLNSGIAANQVVKLDANARLGVNTTTPSTEFTTTSTNTTTPRGVSSEQINDGTQAASLNLLKKRATSPYTVQTNDSTGDVNFSGFDGTSYVRGAIIRGSVTGAVSTGHVPTDVITYTDNGISLSERLRTTSNGHTEYSGTTPAVVTCGTSPSVVGNDNTGTITVGSGVVMACTLNFVANANCTGSAAPFACCTGSGTGTCGTGWTNAPNCFVTGNSLITLDVTSKSTASITFGASATVAGGTLDYFCVGRR